MWEYIVLAVFLISIQLLLMMFGGWLPNFIFGIFMLMVATAYYDLMASGLPLGYLIPFVMVLFVIMGWISALRGTNII